MKSLELSKVSVRFGAVEALNDVSIRIEPGQVMMLVGPNGAGKSTFVRVLLGLVRPDAATLLVDGRKPSNTWFKERLGYLPEAIAFSENLHGRQVLRFFSRARGVPKKRVDEVLERVGLTDAANRRVRGYSRGMRQRLGLAVAILSDPELLVLDEPAGGLDSEGLDVLWSILAEWRERGRMILMASHQLALLERRVDELAIFKSGRIIAQGTPSELRASSGLKERVRIELAATEEPVVALLEALGNWKDKSEFDRDDSKLVVELEPGELLHFMGTVAKHSDAMVGLRVEEPTLDSVYGRLLEAA